MRASAKLIYPRLVACHFRAALERSWGQECPYFDLDCLAERDDLPGDVRCGSACPNVHGPLDRRV